MFSQQSNQINNSNNKFDHRDQSSDYQLQTSNRTQVQTNDTLTSNLDLYIPRVSSGTTEEQVKSLFFQSRIGTVEHCDFAITKDKDTKKPQYTSAFIRLSSWSSKSGACEDFAINKSIRLHLSHSSKEFWIILPNNNPLPRSIVNTSQLAASTDKLFEQTERITEKAAKFEDEMRATIAEMRQMMALQQEKIETLEFQLTLKASITFGEQYPEIFNMKPEPVGDNIVYSLEEPLYKPLSKPLVVALERDFDTEVDALLDAPLQWQIIDHTLSKSDDDDDLELVVPIRPRKIAISNFIPVDPKSIRTLSSNPPLTRSKSVSSYNEEDECVFSNRQNQGQKREPILKTQTRSKKSLTLGEIVAENPERAIGSRDLCGNL
jgi:hypothetical protein